MRIEGTIYYVWPWPGNSAWTVGLLLNSVLVTFTKNLILFLGVGWDWLHLVRRPLFGLLYQAWMIDDDESGAFGGMIIGRGNRSTLRKHALVPLCSPQKPTWPDLGSNPGPRSGKRATNPLSYGTAIETSLYICESLSCAVVRRCHGYSGRGRSRLGEGWNLGRVLSLT
jgi:hypothetical protein